LAPITLLDYVRESMAQTYLPGVTLSRALSFLFTMHRPNTNNNKLPSGGSHRRLDADDDSKSEIDSCSSSSSLEEETAPLFDNDDGEDYVKRLNKTGTADIVSSSGFVTGAGVMAMKTGTMVLARFGSQEKSNVVEEDEVIGAAMFVTKLNPSQLQVLTQMAPQASSSAAGSIGSPMAAVVIPPPPGAAAALASTTVRHACVLDFW
jgi:hypothetical protein